MRQLAMRRNGLLCHIMPRRPAAPSGFRPTRVSGCPRERPRGVSPVGAREGGGEAGVGGRHSTSDHRKGLNCRALFAVHTPPRRERSVGRGECDGLITVVLEDIQAAAARISSLPPFV